MSEQNQVDIDIEEGSEELTPEGLLRNASYGADRAAEAASQGHARLALAWAVPSIELIALAMQRMGRVMMMQRKEVERVDVDLSFLAEGVKSFPFLGSCDACHEELERQRWKYPPQDVMMPTPAVMQLEVYKAWTGRRYRIWRGKCSCCNKVDLVVCSDEAWREVPL